MGFCPGIRSVFWGICCSITWVKHQAERGFENKKNVVSATPTRWVFPKIMVLPNHPILIGFSTINHPFSGTPIFGNTHIVLHEGLTFV